MSYIMNGDAASGNSEFDREIIYFVEGRDDAYFMEEALKRGGISEYKAGIYMVGGRSNYGSAIIAMSRADAALLGSIKRYIIVVDGDEDPERRFADINVQISSEENTYEFDTRGTYGKIKDRTD